MRLDALLVRRGLAASRQRARELIEQGKVMVDGLVATKVGAQVRPSQAVLLRGDDYVWVGRGALKLLGALEAFEVDPAGLVCADFGASTGGFTEVLVERGATKVYAVDVGKGQLAWKLQTHERVVVMDGVNVRHLEGLPDPIDLLVGDLSFISLALVLPAMSRVLGPGGEVVVLVKPQFEAGRSAISSGGVVRDASARQAAIDRVAQETTGLGFEVLGGADSEVAGARSGNVEHFLHLRALTPPR